MKHFVLALLTLPVFSSAGFADTIYLKDGTTISGSIHELWERPEVVDSGDNITFNVPKSKKLREKIEIETPEGVLVVVRSTDVSSIDRSGKTVYQFVDAPPHSAPQPQVRRPIARQERMVVEYKPISRKNPFMAMGMSLAVPGSGQIYNGDYLHGAVHLMAIGFAWDNYITYESGFTLFCCLTIHALSAIDAPFKSLQVNKRNERRSRLGSLLGLPLPGDGYTVHFAPVTTRRGLGTKVTLRF